MRRSQPVAPPDSWYQARKWPLAWAEFDLKGKSVLDLGCNTGWLGWLARESGALVVATDIFREGCHPELPFLMATKEALPLPDGCLDFVLTANVLHHGIMLQTVREALRVLKPNGWFVSLQEPCISVKSNEESYLAARCAYELAAGIDERRPNINHYRAAMGIFPSCHVWLANGDPQMPGKHTWQPSHWNDLDDYEGGLGFAACKGSS